MSAAASSTYALTPGHLKPDDPLDLNDKLGRDIYNRAVEPLKVPFDGSSKNIHLLQSQLRVRAKKSGWDKGTGNIIDVTDVNGNNKNVLYKYGCLSMEELQVASSTYCTANVTTRAAQNNQMMLECILSSITETCFYKICNEDAAYTVPLGEQSAVMLYKLLMSKAQVDTVATNYQFKSRLANLENYMGNVNSNIEMFNSHVKDAKEGLSARGDEASNLIMELFKGYKVASDHEFVKYIKTREDRYLEGETLTDDLLMQLALNKYTIMKENGEWGAPTEQEEQMTALSAELSKKMEALSEITKQIKRGKSNQDRASQQPNNSNSSKARKARKEARHAWKKIPPKQGDPETTVFEERTYHWCPNHQAWCMHLAKDCTYKPEATGSTSSNKSRSTKFSEALSTVIGEIDDEDESEEE